MASARFLLALRARAGRRALGLLAVAGLVSQLGSCTPDFQFPPPGGTGGGMAGVPGSGGMTSSGSAGSGGMTSSGGKGSGGTELATGGMAGDSASGGTGGAVEDHCKNRKIDADETDEDCGGLDCQKCPLQATCELDRDCEIDSCVGKICRPEDCADDVLSPELGETALHCGGSCGPCADGETCNVDADCQSSLCQSKICQVPSCSDKRFNGKETDKDCGGPETDANGDPCPRCDIGRDCVANADCVAPPSGDPSVSACDADVCVLKCPPNKGDCNTSAADGCEQDINIEDYCGACDSPCAPDHAAGQCVAGNCQLTPDSCWDGYANCDGSPANGCEVDLAVDPDYCGSCDVACSDNNGTPKCSARKCSIACAANFDDCNLDVADGCEANLLESTAHCGACGNACAPSQAGFIATCNDGVCDEVECAGGTDCNGQTPCGACQSDMVCDDVLSTVDNCGGCGLTCGVANGSPACADLGGGSYACAVGTCATGYADCDLSYYNGCEVNTTASNSRCGGCLDSDARPGTGSTQGTNCLDQVGTNHIAETTCATSNCKVVSCEGGWADCDGDFTNGCEIETAADGDHCGGCTSGPTTDWDGGISCDAQFANGTGACMDGACTFADCSSPWGDCDGDRGLAVLGNGCETNTNTSAVHCGACSSGAGSPGGGIDCTGAVGTQNIATVSCSGGGCQIGSCTAGREDCNAAFDDGCEINTATNITRCGGCLATDANQGSGQTCTNKPHATATACAASTCQYTCDAGWTNANNDFSDGCESRTIAYVNRSGATPGNMTGAGMSFDYALQGAAGNYRLLIVSLMCKANTQAQCLMTTATYGGQPLTFLAQAGVANSWASLYYMTETGLAAATSSTIALDSDTTWGNIVAQAVEFTGVEQTEKFYSVYNSGTLNNACSNTNPDAQTTLTGLPIGSHVYAIAGGFGNAGTTDAQLPLIDESQNAYLDDVLFGSARVGPVSGNLTGLNFALTNCNQSVILAVGIRPEANYPN